DDLDDDSDDDLDDDSDDDLDDDSDDDSDDGVGDNVDDPDDMEGGEVDVTSIPDKDLIKFMFGKGWKNGINPLEYVDEDSENYLREEFKHELAERFEIAVEQVAELPSEMVVGGVYSKFVAKEEVDVEFYKSTQKTVLEANFGVSVEELSESQIVEHASTYGLANSLELSSVDVHGFVEEYKSEIAEHFEISVEQVAELDASVVKTFILETATEIGLNVEGFVNLEYYRDLGNELVENFRVEQVYSFNYEAAFEYTETQAVSTSAILDTEWFRQENAALIEQNLEELDTDESGEVEDDELIGEMQGQFLEEGLETDDSYDLDEYIGENGDKLTNFYGKPLDEITNRETVEYAFGAGLEEGVDPYSDEFLTENPELQLDTFVAQNAQQLTQFYGVQEVTQINFYQAYQYQVSFGLVGTTTGSSEGIV
ncbi:MAG: hypothetical protein ACOVQ7_05720, partial [Limnoraphis robusta]